MTIPMPDWINSKRVLYHCTCDELKTIHEIYFCRYCNETRCKDCVSHEVNSQFCQQCLEYIPSLDAKIKKNRCPQCYVCPSCHTTLASRVHLQKQAQASNAPQTSARKQTYFFCHFCRWSSRDIGMSDELISTGCVPEPQILEAQRLEKLFDYYRALSLKEKSEKEKKRINHRSAIFLLDKYGISSALSPKVSATLRARMARSSSGVSLADIKSFPGVEGFTSSVALDETEIDQKDRLDLSKYYGDCNDEQETEPDSILLEKNSLTQILNLVEQQPTDCKQFLPISQLLVVKRSLRCKKCDHNLLKPEYNPSLIKFKIQLSANTHIPELRIVQLVQMKLNETKKIVITLTNPTQYPMNVVLSPASIHVNSSASVVLPSTKLQLAQKDYTEEIVDIDSNDSKFNDDPNVVAFRKDNKLGVFLFVTPNKSNVDCLIEFCLKHDYIHTILTPTGNENKSQSTTETKWITHLIQVNLGNVQE